MTTRVKLTARPHLTLHRLWPDGEHGAPITTDHGDFFLVEGRRLLLERDDMTSEITVRAVNGDVRVRLLEGAKSQPRIAEEIIVRDGETRDMIHIHSGRWAEVREQPSAAKAAG